MWRQERIIKLQCKFINEDLVLNFLSIKEYEMDVNSHLAAPDGIEATRKLTDAEDI